MNQHVKECIAPSKSIFDIPIEITIGIADFPIENGDFPYFFVCLPEGKSWKPGKYEGDRGKHHRTTILLSPTFRHLTWRVAKTGDSSTRAHDQLPIFMSLVFTSPSKTTNKFVSFFQAMNYSDWWFGTCFIFPSSQLTNSLHHVSEG